MKKLFPLTLLLLTLMPVLRAQSTIQVQVPNVVAVDEQFNVTFVIEGENTPSDFSWSPGDDFKLVWGPQKGSSTSISIVNGKKTRSAQTTFTYILLPKATGKFTLPPASAKLKGESLSSGPVSIEVVTGGASAGVSQTPRSQGGGSSSSSSSGGSGAAATGEISSSDLFLRLSLSRSNVVVGEPVTATLKLYQRVNITGFEDAKFPTFNGFWNQEVFSPTNIEFHRETLDDKIYNAAVLRRWVLIPQQAGDLAIDPAELVCQVAVRSASGPRSIFDSFFDDDVRTIRKRLVSQRQVVHVSALPAGAPASFGNGVGRFSLSAEMSRDSLKAHDAASLVLTVSGNGNVSLLEAPKVSFPPDFDVYDVKVTENTDKSTGRTSGSKTFEYPFIPRSHGEFTIEPVRYSYYDVSERKYVTLTTEPLTVRVSRGSESEEPLAPDAPLISGVRSKDVRNLGSDIRFISTQLPSFSGKGSFLCFSPLFWTLLGALLLLFCALYLGLRAWSARRSDVVGSRNRGAVKLARKSLSTAGTFLEKNLYTAFYEELHKALLGYVSDKLNMDTREMSKEHIAASLQERGVSGAHTASLTDLLDACEYARYSPDSGHEAMDAHYQSALDVIAFIENDMKRKPSAASSALPTLLLLLMLCPATLRGQNERVDSLWTHGVEAYTAGAWEEALSDWLAIEQDGLSSVRLYCNIADACFKQEDYARAILYYERALKIDPSDADARFNLEFARGFVQDKIDTVPQFFLSGWIRSLSRSLSSDGWTLLFFILLALALGGVLLFLLGTAKTPRKVGFFAAILLLVLSLGCLGFAAGGRSAALRMDDGIVLRPVCPVRSAPGAEGAKDLFILHEGTKVHILDQVGGWWNIELSDGRQGWISASDADLI